MPFKFISLGEGYYPATVVVGEDGQRYYRVFTGSSDEPTITVPVAEALSLALLSLEVRIKLAALESISEPQTRGPERK